MDDIIIYCQNNSELAEFEASNKGFRSDIFVKVIDSYFKVNVYDMVRLQQDFETEIEYYGFFGIEPNIIIVNELKTSIIKNTIEYLHKQRYFENLKPIKIEEVDLKSLLEI